MSLYLEFKSRVLVFDENGENRKREQEKREQDKRKPNDGF